MGGNSPNGDDDTDHILLKLKNPKRDRVQWNVEMRRLSQEQYERALSQIATARLEPSIHKFWAKSAATEACTTASSRINSRIWTGHCP